jgi:hypothetical protein
MTEPPHDRLSDEEPGVPRWVKVSGAIAFLAVVAVVVVLLLTGGHGPGRHSSPVQGETSSARS